MSLKPPSYHVIEAARLLGVQLELLDKERAGVLRYDIVHKYTSRENDPLWHTLTNQISVQDIDGWSRIDDYLRGAGFLLFFDKHRDEAILEFAAGN